MFKIKLLFFCAFIVSMITFCFAQEAITITTYYPSPYGSYKELETEILYFRETTDGLISFNYPDTTYDRRLRITAGRSDTADNDQGASIDLHGNNHADAGRLDLVAGRNNDITFWSSPAGTGALQRMTLDENGNVGIGTADPGAKLEVYQDANSSWRLGEHPSYVNYSALWNSGRGNVAGSYVLLADNSNTFLNAFGAGNLYFREDNNNLMTILNGGNVGIGTASPNYMLHIGAGDGDPWLQFSDASTGTTTSDGFLVGANNSGAYLIQREDRFLRFRTNDADRVTIDKDGQVGIGTTDPTYRLEINGFGNAFYINGGSADNGRLYTSYGPDANPTFQYAPALNFVENDDPFFLRFVQNFWPGDAGYISLYRGRVGFNVKNPAYRIDVTGNVNISGCYKVNGTNIGGGCGSDIRLKKNIKPLSGSLEKVIRLKPSSFEFANPEPVVKGIQYGLVAQDVEKVFPDWVGIGEDGYKTIMYGLQIQMHLIEAVKELKARNDALEQRIKALEAD